LISVPVKKFTYLFENNTIKEKDQQYVYFLLFYLSACLDSFFLLTRNVQTIILFRCLL